MFLFMNINFFFINIFFMNIFSHNFFSSRQPQNKNFPTYILTATYCAYYSAYVTLAVLRSIHTVGRNTKYKIEKHPDPPGPRLLW